MNFLVYTMGAAWTCLGLYRGIKLHTFEMRKHAELCKTVQEHVWCSPLILSGILGVGVYWFPITGVLAFCKELQRIEMYYWHNVNTDNYEYYWLL